LLHIVQVETDAHKRQVSDLLREYLVWGTAEVNRIYGSNFDPDTLLEQEMQEGGKYAPPEGRMLLALDGDEAVGLICLRKIGAEMSEVKRLYIRPAFRGRGIGGQMVARVCEEARAEGYTRIRLDSGPFMKAAHAVYRAAGFREIAQYPESDVPPGFDPNWLFMELIL
jgi:GNAT superfamily N-acetyltransferase